jgi:hypothetical protein
LGLFSGMELGLMFSIAQVFILHLHVILCAGHGVGHDDGEGLLHAKPLCNIYYVAGGGNHL